MKNPIAEKLRFKYAPVEPFVYRQIDIGLLAIPVSEVKIQSDEELALEEGIGFVIRKK